MPREYKKKTVKLYTLEDVNAAIRSVQDDDLTYYQASKQFGVPESTIRNRIKRNTSATQLGAGRPTLLSKAIEDELAANVLFLAEYNHPLTQNEVLKIVQEYFIYTKKPNPFSKTNSAPGREWIEGFLKRHPSISKRKAEALQAARVQSSTRASFIIFFDILQKKLLELKITNPQQILNVDETGYGSAISTSVLAQKGKKTVSQIQPGSGKESFTVVETASADGHMFPPFIIFAGKNLYNTWCVGGPEGSGYDASENGWENKKTFLHYFQMLIKWTEEYPKPILLLYDGHTSHIQFAISQLAIKNGIHILTLPAHTSQLIQPLDVAVFGPAKKAWLRIKRNYYQDSNYQTISKEVFPTLMRNLRDAHAFPPANIRAGFKASGIWPFDRNKVLDQLPLELPDDQMPSTSQNPAPMPSTSHVNPSSIPTTSDKQAIDDNSDNHEIRSAVDLSKRTPYDNVASFRHVLLKSISPKDRPKKTSKRKLTFNNRALTETDVMQQMKEREEAIEVKKQKAEKKSQNKDKAPAKAKQTKQKKPLRKQHIPVADSSDTCDDNLPESIGSSVDSPAEYTTDIEEENSDRSINEDVQSMQVPRNGDFVTAIYDEMWYIASVEDVENDGKGPLVTLKFMACKGSNKFVWPDKDDILDVTQREILSIVKDPVPVSRRYLGLQQECLKKTLKLWSEYQEKIL